MISKKEFSLLSLLLIIFTANPVLSVPMLINYQGQLTDSSNEPVIDDDYSMRFSLFDADVDGNRLWNSTDGEEQVVTVTNGVYSVQLGAVDSLETGVFNAPEVWMEVAIYNADTSSWETLSPRQLLTSTAYAIKAGDADTLQGIPAETFVTTESDPTVEPSIKDGISWDELSGIPPDIADGDNDSGGDITAVIAETGLVGGGFAGDIPLSVDFSGSGVDLMAAHSDHHHDGFYAPEIHSHDAGNISTGMLDPDRFSAFEDLAGEGHLNNDSGTDLLLKDQADASYWKLSGNFGTGLILGTLEPQPLELRVHNQHALRLEPGTTPNLIGGFAGNFVSEGVVGATISGGGQDSLTNRVTDNYGTVGGGEENQAGNGDISNINSGYATVGGGASNIASRLWTTVGGGGNNTASGNNATVGGGLWNTASGNSATVGGGSTNTVAGTAATVAGGVSNIVTGSFATVLGGLEAKADIYGQMAYASGTFTVSLGTAQTSVYVLRNIAFGTDNVELFLDGPHESERLTVENGRTMTFNILVVARSAGGNSAGYKIEGVIENYNGTVSMVGTPSAVALGEDIGSWYANVAAGTTPPALRIWVGGGLTGETIRWVARVETAEVAF